MRTFLFSAYVSFPLHHCAWLHATTLQQVRTHTCQIASWFSLHGLFVVKKKNLSTWFCYWQTCLPFPSAKGSLLCCCFYSHSFTTFDCSDPFRSPQPWLGLFCCNWWRANSIERLYFLFSFQPNATSILFQNRYIYKHTCMCICVCVCMHTWVFAWIAGVCKFIAEDKLQVLIDCSRVLKIEFFSTSFSSA